VAAQCLAVAQTTADLKVRKELVHMAARLHNLASDGMRPPLPSPFPSSNSRFSPRKASRPPQLAASYRAERRHLLVKSVARGRPKTSRIYPTSRESIRVFPEFQERIE
jgi:hypothetical protein